MSRSTTLFDRHTHTHTYVDVETGEVIDEKVDTDENVLKKDVKKRREEMFFSVYYDSPHFETLVQLSKSDVCTLIACASLAGFYGRKAESVERQGNMFMANWKFRKEVAQLTHLADDTIKSSLRSLVEKVLLIKDSECKAVYYLNPELIFCGYSGSRTKLLNSQVRKYDVRIAPEDYEALMEVARQQIAPQMPMKKEQKNQWQLKGKRRKPRKRQIPNVRRRPR